MADVLTTQRLAAALAAGFGEALEAVLGTPITIAPGPAMADRGWSTSVAVSGTLAGTLTASVDAEGARGVATQMMHLEDEPEDSVVSDMLRELWRQAATAAAGRDGFDGLMLVTGAPSNGPIAAGGDVWVARAGDARLATMALAGEVVVAAVSPHDAATAGPQEAGSGTGAGNLAALLDIELPLVVRFARTELSLRELTLLGPGSMVDMGRSPDDPVQLLVGSQVIAEGEVVVVAGNYGVRITSLVSPAERLKAMEL